MEIIELQVHFLSNIFVFYKKNNEKGKLALQMETWMNKEKIIADAFNDLEEERRITKKHISEDICKMSEALSSLKDLSVEGSLIREDLLGLLEFEGNNVHEIDVLMVERRKDEEFGRRFLQTSEKIILQ